jgi:hypothetical protein
VTGVEERGLQAEPHRLMVVDDGDPHGATT